MDPFTIGAMALGGLTSGFSAAMQYGAGQRQAKIELWQANEQRQAAWKEAASVGQSAVDQALRSSRLYKLSQDIAQSNMRLAGMRSNVEENRSRDATDRAIGQQQAFFASANLDPTMGSPLALASSAAAQGEADVAIIRARGQQERAEQGWNAFSAAESADYALRTGQKQIDGAFEAASARAKGLTSSSSIAADNARMAGIYGAATTLLNGATSWMKTPGLSSTVSGWLR